MKTELTGESTDLLRVVLPAASRGDLETVKRIVKSDRDWVLAIGPHERTMLWEAARKGRLDVARFLVGKGAEINVAACYYSEHFVDIAAYCVAKSNGHSDVAEYLRKQGAVVDVFSLSYLGDIDGVTKELRKRPSLLNRDFRAKPRAKKEYEATPLHYAVAGSSAEIVRSLIEKGAEVVIPGGMLLRWAVWRDNLEVVRLLLDSGADPAESGITDWATDDKYVELVKQYGYGFDIDMRDWMGYPALVNESRGNHNMPDDPKRVTRLLDRGADVNVSDYKGKTALHRASQANFLGIAQTLLNHGADIEARDDRGETPLFDAVKAGRSEMVQFLVRKKASLAAVNNSGRSAVDYAKSAKKQSIRDVYRYLRPSKRPR